MKAKRNWARKACTTVLVVLLSMTAYAQNGLKKVYDETVNPMEQIDNAVAKARSEGKFVVCQVGGNWCPWCLRFADFITNDTTISRLIDENFVYIHVNYDPRKSRNAGTAQQNERAAATTSAMLRRLKHPERFGFPVFVVLNDMGEVIHIQDSSFLEEGQGYDQKKVLRFFKNWTPKVFALRPHPAAMPSPVRLT